MIIYDGIISLIQKTGGATVLFDEIYSRLMRDEIDFKLFHFGNSEKPNIKLTTIKPRFLERYRDFQSSLIKDVSPSIFHSTCYRIQDKKLCPIITTVHDFTYEKVIGGIKSLVHSTQKNRAIKSSDQIICVSESTKNDLLHYLPSINPESIDVIYNGVSEDFFLKEGKRTKAYVLYVGQRVEYKNFKSAVLALVKHKDLSLCCVGGGAFTSDELIFLNKNLPGRYHHSGYITTAELNNLYNEAFCFIYPSKYEGFGIPIAESMRAGCPVISVNNSSIPEVAGNAAILVENGTPDELEEAIKMFYDTERRENCIKRGVLQSMKFNWEATYSQTLKLYQKITN